MCFDLFFFIFEVWCVVEWLSGIVNITINYRIVFFYMLIDDRCTRLFILLTFLACHSENFPVLCYSILDTKVYTLWIASQYENLQRIFLGFMILASITSRTNIFNIQQDKLPLIIVTNIGIIYLMIQNTVMCLNAAVIDFLSW